MKTKLLIGSAIVAALAATGASAQAVGWYGAIDLGGHFPQDISASSPVGTVKWRLKDGFVAGGRVGYQFTPNWRLEGEVGYHDSGIDSITTVNGALLGASGSADTWTWIGN